MEQARKDLIDRKFEDTDKLKVEFIKKNGEHRTMLCTTNMDFVPIEFHPKGTSERKRNPDIKVVYDLEVQGWRSFRYDAVITIYKIEDI